MKKLLNENIFTLFFVGVMWDFYVGIKLMFSNVMTDIREEYTYFECDIFT